jgi:hypothetical protein
LADAVEELAGLPVERPAGFSPLRIPLAVEAALCARAARATPARGRHRRLRNLQRRVVAKARAVTR